MKKYFDHEIKVKIIDNILEKNENWEFLVQYVDNNFQIEDINSWSGFMDICRIVISNIYSFLLHISNYLNHDLKFKNSIIEDLYLIAKFQNNKVTYKNCSSHLVTEFGRMFLLFQWINSKFNVDNSTEYTFNFDIFTTKNYWQIYSLVSIQEQEDFVLGELNQFELDDFEIPREIFIDNLSHKLYESNEEYIQVFKSTLYHANAFNYTDSRLDYGTWQEKYLLDMVKISFENKKIEPMVSYRDGQGNPDITRWSKDILINMKSYFTNNVSDFIIETVNYILYGNKISDIVINTHIEMLLHFSKRKTHFEIINCSSFKIISYLFKDKMMVDVSTTSTAYKELLEGIQSETEIEKLEDLQMYGFPISKNQGIVIKEYYRKRFEEITELNDIYSLSKYLKDINIAKAINEERFQKIKIKFREIIQEDSSVMVASLFIDYMEFLFHLSNNQNIESRNAQIEIIEVQQLWEKIYYQIQASQLKEFKQEVKIPTQEVDSINKQLLTNPIGFIASIFSTQDTRLIQTLQDISSNSLSLVFQKIAIKPQFPQKIEINSRENSVDALLKEKIERILQEKSYKFLNVFDVEKYILELHENFRMSIVSLTNLINIKSAYNFVSSKSDFTLIKFTNEFSVAHLTQLFPLLEMKIRELSIIIGISPYKNNLHDFMKYKDPSSLLRVMIDLIFKESDTFENIPDLVFVYNTMYNGNSINIRNEAIHARDFIDSSTLPFAIVTTMISIMAINQRIELYLKN